MSWKYCWSTIKMFFEQSSVLFQPKSAAGCAADWNPTWKSESKKLLCDSGNWTIKIIIRHCVTYNAMKIIISLVIIMSAFYYGCRCQSRRDWQGDKDLRHEETDSYCITSKVLIIIITRPKPAYDQQGLAGKYRSREYLFGCSQRLTLHL